MNTTLGDRLKELRKSKNITQEELAKIFHLTRNSISNYENDQVIPSIEVIIIYCRYFEVSSDYLLNIINDSKNSNLEHQIVNQISKTVKRLNKVQKEKYLKNLKLYAVFLERYKDSL